MVMYNRQSAAPNVAPMPQNRRRIRKPTHTWHLRHRPFVIQPLCFAPVQAGETMKNMLWQARAITDPIKNPLIGWFLEYYWFYVKMSHLGDLSELEWLYKPGGTQFPTRTTAALEMYTKASAGAPQADFQARAYQFIVNEWFRKEGETYAFAPSGALARAQRTSNDVFDSVQLAANLTSASADSSLTVGVDDVITGSEIEKLQREYELRRMSGLAPMSFDDYLRQQGVNMPAAITQAYRPELLRYSREWQYPSNTVEPTTGVPSSAVSWAIAERADKDRFFGEPGFVVGLTLARPKIYLKAQAGSLVGMMNTAYEWLPTALMDDISAAIQVVPVADLSLNNTADIMIDFRDLFEHGEQFLNFDPAGTYAYNGANMIDGELLGRYPAEADVNAFFVNVANNNVRQDGVADFQIATQLPSDPLPGNDISV